MDTFSEPFSGIRPGGRIIAVGGAKGGIGKSLFSANLAVTLSRLGYRTVIVDLDLGGANLHLYLGERTIKRTLNHYLNKVVPELEDVILENRYGPLLIGGDNSELGAANISFALKFKLLKAIQRLDADYIVLDLGSNVSYNILDFFNAADYPIVVTTPEPAAYLGAYRFIKVALYRRLDRLFGVESEYYARKDPALERLIRQAIGKGESRAPSIDKLLERVRTRLPDSFDFLVSVLGDYRPLLVMNKIIQGQDTGQIVESIRKTSREMLSLEVEFLGGLPYSADIERSARELVPVVAEDPEGELAESISRLIDHTPEKSVL